MRSYRAAACLGLSFTLAGCMGDPDVRVRRQEKNVYLISSDRCSPFEDDLQRDIRERAAQVCSQGSASLDHIRPLPSRQGSLLGECLRAGKLEARVTCHGKDTQP